MTPLIVKKGIAIVIGVAIVLIVAGVAFSLSTSSDKEIDELTNPEPESEVTEITEVPAGKNLRIDLSESIGVRGE